MRKDWYYVTDAWTCIIHEPIKEILADALEDYPPQEPDICMEYLELHRSLEISGEDVKQANLVTDFHGYGTMTLKPGIDLKEDEEPKIINTGFAIELTPIPYLLDYPLRYNPECLVIENYEVKDKYEVLELTLIDLVKNVFWELSFFGSPAERNVKSEELEEVFESFEDDDDDDLDI